jgi:hypothetical protein
MTYIAPEFEKKAFHCPHCGVFAAQAWDWIIEYQYGTSNTTIGGFNLPMLSLS